MGAADRLPPSCKEPSVMPASDLVNLSGLLDDAKCFALVRQLRWPEGVRCPGCGRDAVIRAAATTPNLIGSGIAARSVRGALTILPARRWPGTISRCGCG